MPNKDTPALPRFVTRALDAYRDICRKGGDSTPDRLVVVEAIRDYGASLVSRALDVVMPERATDDELVTWLDNEIATADLEVRRYNENGESGSNADESRAAVEFWANEARMLRCIRERLTATIRSNAA